MDWGLGHTTRCIPIIRHLLHQGHKVTVAGNEVQLNLLLAACPGIHRTKLEGYNVGYGKNKYSFMAVLLAQMPHLLRTIKYEQAWLSDFVVENKIDGILSDNRYGLHHSTIPTVFMTHQLQVQTGLGIAIDQQIRKLHYRFFRKFNQIWVVDRTREPGLAGTLSHPEKLPKNACYIGWLSQLTPTQQQNPSGLLILLSGPEPQRTILSKLLWEQAIKLKTQITFVEGAPQIHQLADIPQHIKYFGRLSAFELQPLLAEAAMVICRSGYSTLMDLILLQKKAVVIPTPGQTEQLYLARHLQQQKYFLAAQQDGFQLEKALQDAMAFPYKILAGAGSHTAFVRVVDEWVAGL